MCIFSLSYCSMRWKKVSHLFGKHYHRDTCLAASSLSVWWMIENKVDSWGPHSVWLVLASHVAVFVHKTLNTSPIALRAILKDSSSVQCCIYRSDVNNIFSISVIPVFKWDGVSGTSLSHAESQVIIRLTAAAAAGNVRSLNAWMWAKARLTMNDWQLCLCEQTEL